MMTVATAMVSGAGGTRVLEISGVGVGDATITVTVNDGRDVKRTLRHR